MLPGELNWGWRTAFVSLPPDQSFFLAVGLSSSFSFFLSILGWCGCLFAFADLELSGGRFFSSIKQ